jgi:bacteriophage exclusion system BrxA-like protein
MGAPRSQVVSSFTIIKGSLIEETYAAFAGWNLSLSKHENLRLLQEDNRIGARSHNWLRDVRKVINRRFDPEGRDRPLVELAQGSCDRAIWRPLLLWHITRDEFLVRDFLTNWLYRQYVDGAYGLKPDDVVPYLDSLAGRTGIAWSGDWSSTTTARVASGLLRIAADFGLLTGVAVKRFVSYHLPEESFLYLLHAIAQSEPNPGRIVDSPEWRIYLMDADEVERELLRLHQFHRLEYEAAGSLARLDLPAASPGAYARELVA